MKAVMEDLKGHYLRSNLSFEDFQLAWRSLREGNFLIFKSYCLNRESRPTVHLRASKQMQVKDLTSLIMKLDYLKTKIYCKHHFYSDSPGDIQLVSTLTDILLKYMAYPKSHYSFLISENNWTLKFVVINNKPDDRWDKFMAELYSTDVTLLSF